MKHIYGVYNSMRMFQTDLGSLDLSCRGNVMKQIFGCCFGFPLYLKIKYRVLAIRKCTRTHTHIFLTSKDFLRYIYILGNILYIYIFIFYTHFTLFHFGTSSVLFSFSESRFHPTPGIWE